MGLRIGNRVATLAIFAVLGPLFGLMAIILSVEIMVLFAKPRAVGSFTLISLFLLPFVFRVTYMVGFVPALVSGTIAAAWMQGGNRVFRMLALSLISGTGTYAYASFMTNRPDAFTTNVVLVLSAVAAVCSVVCTYATDSWCRDRKPEIEDGNDRLASPRCS